MIDSQRIVSEFGKQHIEQIGLLRQSSLLSGGDLISFGRERGIASSGVLEEDPGAFLGADGLKRMALTRAVDLCFTDFVFTRSNAF